MENMAGFMNIKIPDSLNLHNNSHDHLYSTLFLTTMQKRAKHSEVKLPFFNNKSSKNTYYAEVEIY